MIKAGLTGERKITISSNIGTVTKGVTENDSGLLLQGVRSGLW
jgi:hypothetical protein